MRTITATLLTLSLLSPITRAQQSTDPRPDPRLQRFDSILARAEAERESVALSVAIMEDGELIYANAAGLAEVEHNAPATTDTLFRIASLTKQFTAAAIMKLAEDNKLTLDDPITKHLPDYNTHDRNITIRHLLTHTSGIPSYTSLGPAWLANIGDELTHTQMRALFEQLPLNFEPGEQFEYSNSGYYLLGLIIESAGAITYADYLDTTFFTPNQLDDIRYDSNADIIPGRAQGYTYSFGAHYNDTHMGVSQPYAAGALLATATDLARWAELLAGGKLVSPDSYAQMTTPFTLNSGEPSRYAFGLIAADFESHPVIVHGGGINGFSSSLMRFNENQRNLTIAVLSNSEAFSASNLSRDLARAALNIPDPSDLPLTETEANRLTGDYEILPLKPGLPALPIRFSMQDGALHAQAQGQPANRLLHQGDSTFVASFDKSVRIVFDNESPAQSFILHQGGMQLEGRRTTNQD